MKLMIANGRFTVHNLSGSVKCENTDRDTAVRILQDSGVGDDEVDAALQDMASKHTNVAHFGIEGTFIFSEQLKGNLQWH